MTINAALHKNIMLQILKDIYSDTSISSSLGFKGGTAAYLFYDLERFSVDLDFDLLDDNKRDLIFTKIEVIAKNYGKLKDLRKKRYSLFFLLSYEEKVQNIKIEINCRSFGSRYEIKTYLGISMLVMIKEDMFANKLVAMYERLGKTNRDIYDIWFFLKNNWSINKNIVEHRTNMSFQELLQKCIDLLEKTSNRNILSGIGELLDEKKKAWAKEHLLADTIFLLKLKQNN
jgi:predicted nucleotidyltransferase component of viral defense system